MYKHPTLGSLPRLARASIPQYFLRTFELAFHLAVLQHLIALITSLLEWILEGALPRRALEGPLHWAMEGALSWALVGPIHRAMEGSRLHGPTWGHYLDQMGAHLLMLE